MMRHLLYFVRLTAIVAFCSTTLSVANASVTLGLVDVDTPGTGLHRYTLTATGIGITTLSRFTISGDVHQVFGAGGEQSEWIGVGGGASPSETTDSHVLFGELRLPDLGGATWDWDTYPQGPPDKVTLETITGGGTVGFGTLNNSDTGPAFNDVYMKVSTPPSTVEETVDLIQIVVQDGGGFSINLKLLTSTEPEGIMEYDNLILTLDALIGGDANGDGKVDVIDLGTLATYYNQLSGATWANADFTGDGAVDVDDLGILATNYVSGSGSAVPEPSTLSLLALGALTLIWRRRK